MKYQGLNLSTFKTVWSRLETSVNRDSLLVHLRQDVADVVPGVAVQTLLQSLLIQEMANEPDRAAQNEETVEGSVLDYVL